MKIKTAFLVFSISISFSFICLAQDKIKIGVPVPLSGVASSYGTDIKNALIFANRKLANSTYELIIEDDQCSDKEAVSIAHKLVNVDKVKYALGFGCSGTVLSSAPIYEKAKVVVIASGTGAPLISYAGDYIFRTKPSLNIAGAKIAEDMSKKFKKIGILTEETAYCQGLTDTTTKRAEDLSLVTIRENYLPQALDFRTEFLRLKTKGAEAIFLNTQGESTYIAAYKQLQSMAWKVPVYGTFMPGTESFLKTFGSSADGLIFADVPFNNVSLNKNGLTLYAEFEKEYGPAKGGEHFVTFSLLSFATLHQAILSGEDVKNYLYKTKFNGIFGDYSFDKNGDIVSDRITYGLKIIKNGQPETY